MAVSIVTSFPAARNVDVKKFRDNSSATKDDVKLDVVSNKTQNGGGGGNESPLKKIVKFRPDQLKNLNTNIQRNVAEAKQRTQTREAQRTITRERTSSIKEQNPLNSPLESQVGSKIDLST